MKSSSNTDRDHLMLQTIAAFGVAPATNLSTLHFYLDNTGERLDPMKWQDKPHSNCQYRLKVLAEQGLIAHIEQPSLRSEGRKPFLHMLTPKGARLLADHLGCQVSDLVWRKVSKDSRSPFLEHLRWINEVRTAIQYAIQVSNRQAELMQWSDDGELGRLHAAIKKDVGRSVVLPDSFFQMRTQAPTPIMYYTFLEIDRGTETGASTVAERGTWKHKIEQYTEFFGSGLFAKYYSAPQGRVLTITTGPKRLARLKAITEEANGRSRFLFTTFDCIKPVLGIFPDQAEPVHTVLSAPIWQKAGHDGTHSFWLN